MIHKVGIFRFQHGFQRCTFCRRRPFRLNLSGRAQLHHQLCRQKFRACTAVPADRRHFGSFFLSLPCRVQKTACPQPFRFMAFCGKGNPFCPIIRLNRIAQIPHSFFSAPNGVSGTAAAFAFSKSAILEKDFFRLSSSIIRSDSSCLPRAASSISLCSCRFSCAFFS